MIKQFNFYDIYGYLLPGGLLLGMFWLPLGVVTLALPSETISKAVFLAGLAYIAGLLVQAVGAFVVPSKIKGRVYSELVFDEGEEAELGVDVRKRLSEQVKQLFKIDLQVDKDGSKEPGAIAGRQTAFFQARTYLIQKKAAAYAEQFEGMYVMMRGLACALGAGAVYGAGWALSVARSHAQGSASLVWVGQHLAPVMKAVTVVAVVGTLVVSLGAVLSWNAKVGWTKPLWPKVLVAAVWLGDCLSGGFWIGSMATPLKFKPAHPQAMLWAVVVVAVFAMLQCYSEYHRYTKVFALTVWRDFSALYALNPGDGLAKPGGDA